jgi:arylsulfatase A-like enzyme
LAVPACCPARASKHPPALIDVAPTVLAALGLDIPRTMLGQPLAAAFGAPAMPWGEVVAQAGRHGYRQEVRARRVAGATYLMQGSVGR